MQLIAEALDGCLLRCALAVPAPTSSHLALDEVRRWQGTGGRWDKAEPVTKVRVCGMGWQGPADLMSKQDTVEQLLELFSLFKIVIGDPG